MKKGVKVLLLILAVVAAAGAGLLIWQWENLQAVSLSLATSSEDLEELRQKNDAAMTSVMEELEELQLQPLEEADRERLRNGELSEEEAIEMVLGQMGSQTEADPAEPETSAVGETNTVAQEEAEPQKIIEPPEEAAETNQAVELPPETETTEPAAAGPEQTRAQRIAELVAKVYVMRDLYVGDLDAMLQSAIDEYTALAPEERTNSAKLELAARWIGEAASLEQTCNGKMDAILEELSGLLEEQGQTQELVQQIRAAYEDEKALKKAYYMQKYLK